MSNNENVQSQVDYQGHTIILTHRDISHTKEGRSEMKLTKHRLQEIIKCLKRDSEPHVTNEASMTSHELNHSPAIYLQGIVSIGNNMLCNEIKFFMSRRSPGSGLNASHPMTWAIIGPRNDCWDFLTRLESVSFA